MILRRMGAWISVFFHLFFDYDLRWMFLINIDLKNPVQRVCALQSWKLSLSLSFYYRQYFRYAFLLYYFTSILMCCSFLALMLLPNTAQIWEQKPVRTEQLDMFVGCKSMIDAYLCKWTQFCWKWNRGKWNKKLLCRRLKVTVHSRCCTRFGECVFLSIGYRMDFVSFSTICNLNQVGASTLCNEPKFRYDHYPFG